MNAQRDKNVEPRNELQEIVEDLS